MGAQAVTALKTTVQSILTRLGTDIEAASTNIREVLIDPDDRAALKLPSVMLTFASEPILHRRRPQWRELGIPIRVQVFVAKIDTQRAFVTARDLLCDILDKLDLDVTVGGYAGNTDWEDGQGMRMAKLEWGGNDYVGADGLLRVWVRAGLTFT